MLDRAFVDKQTTGAFFRIADLTFPRRADVCIERFFVYKQITSVFLTWRTFSPSVPMFTSSVCLPTNYFLLGGDVYKQCDVYIERLFTNRLHVLLRLVN